MQGNLQDELEDFPDEEIVLEDEEILYEYEEDTLSTNNNKFFQADDNILTKIPVMDNL